MVTAEHLLEMALDEIPDPEARIEKAFSWEVERMQAAAKAAFALAALLLAALIPVVLLPSKTGVGSAVLWTGIAIGLSTVVGLGFYLRQKRVSLAYLPSLGLYQRLRPIADGLRPFVRP
jgi:hypothetical protein